MSLDLEEGNEALADASPRERRRAARQAAAQERNVRKETTTKQSKKPPSKTSESRIETELSSRLLRTLDRIARMLEAREDEELSQAIRDDAQAMSQGLVSLTSSVKLLRTPLLMSLNLIEPVLAFGRVFRILFGRWNARNARIAMEREAAQREAASSVAPQ